jgi:YHS domain-containing protein/thiol-disulfide isomerase/thioredoxin
MSTRTCIACTLAVLLGIGSSATANDSIQWAPDYAAAQEIAQVQQRPVLVHFWSPSCVPCLRLEKEVFARPEVGQAINAHYVPVKVNADEFPQLAEQFGIRSIPSDVVVTSTGQMLYKTISPASPETYVQKLVGAAQSPTTMIAQRLSQRAVDPSSTGPASSAAVGDPGAPQLSAVAPWTQQVSTTQQAAQQQAQAWQHQLQQQTQHLVNQAGQQLNTGVAQATERVSNATQPWGERATQTADQVAQTAETFQSAVEQARPAVPPPSLTSTNQLEQLNPFATGLASQAAPAAANATAGPTNFAASPAPNPATSSATPGGAPGAAAVPTQASTLTESLSPATPSHVGPTGPDAAATVADPSSGSSAGSDSQLSSQSGAGNPSSSAADNRSPLPGPPAAPSRHSPAAANPAARLGLDGFCPVALMEENRWQAGDKRWGAVHRGRTYLFASRKNQLEFLANPDRYSPVLAGIDPVVLTTQGRIAEGKRAHGVVYKDEVHGDQIYLFSSEDSLKEFWITPTAYAGTVRQAMMDGTVGRFLR